MIRVKKATPRPLVLYLEKARVVLNCSPFVQHGLEFHRRHGLSISYQRSTLNAVPGEPRLSPKHLQHFYDNYWFASETQHLESKQALAESAKRPGVQRAAAALRKGEGSFFVNDPEAEEHLALRARGGFKGCFRPLNSFGEGSLEHREKQRKERMLSWVERHFGSLEHFAALAENPNAPGGSETQRKLIEQFLAKKQWEMARGLREERERKDYYLEMAERIRFFHERRTGEPPSLPASLTLKTSAEDPFDCIGDNSRRKLEMHQPAKTEDKNFRMFQYLDEMHTEQDLNTAAVESIYSSSVETFISPQNIIPLLRLSPHADKPLFLREGSEELRVEPAKGKFTFSLKKFGKNFTFSLEKDHIVLMQNYLEFLKPLLMGWQSDTIYVEPSSDKAQQYLNEAQMMDLLGRIKTKTEILNNELDRAKGEKRARQLHQNNRHSAHREDTEDNPNRMNRRARPHDEGRHYKKNVEENSDRYSFEDHKLKEMEELRKKIVNSPLDSRSRSGVKNLP